jgi:hypothetical protein
MAGEAGFQAIKKAIVQAHKSEEKWLVYEKKLTPN